MTMYLVDNVASEVDPEFDAALFVACGNPHDAARMWENHYERGAKVVRVTEVPTDMHQGVIPWDSVHIVEVKL